ncbi:hypothetical protein SPRG_11295 [Saprolegnia parasitica CBS 223.65]|uniref:FYVE-type domain-containing protein n=1 Tax=Saprolegnia parasitica (strain CBS 223.65) TaxID=695850 RepID=A0A067BZB0_SAPPC|nr:hypothetical protein SPRG_11295 [Saprolegnia parasitica CBS 223.65]KDO23864.1 hypothetical protein SPRG_11295 [Saprolegnia parasitica CBS 223.65]|eukprot:XP_012205496.1 hypothetical protein SPRG_11295 [Saprolegnia parasitica CBS 223.65]
MHVPVFHLPMLSVDEQASLVSLGASAFCDLIDTTARLDRNRHAAVQLPARHPDVDDRISFHASTLVKHTNLDAIATYHITATEANDVYCRTFHCLLTSVLYTLELPSAGRPYHYVAVRWLLLPSTLPWVKPRDVVVIEYMDSYVGRDGVPGFARCVHSIDHRCAPSLVATHGFVRGHFDHGHSFASRYATKSVCAGLLRHFDTLNERIYVHFHVLPRKISVSASTWRPDDFASTSCGDRTACTYCMQAFHLLRRPTLCETCHQILCKKCTRRITKTSRHRVCLTCYVRHEIDGSPRPIFAEPMLLESPGWSEFCARRPPDDRFVQSV